MSHQSTNEFLPHTSTMNWHDKCHLFDVVYFMMLLSAWHMKMQQTTTSFQTMQTTLCIVNNAQQTTASFPTMTTFQLTSQQLMLQQSKPPSNNIQRTEKPCKTLQGTMSIPRSLLKGLHSKWC